MKEDRKQLVLNGEMMPIAIEFTKDGVDTLIFLNEPFIVRIGKVSPNVNEKLHYINL